MNLTKNLICLAALSCAMTSLAVAETPLSASGEASKAAFESILKPGSGPAPSIGAVLKMPGTVEYLSAPEAMMGFAAISDGIKHDPQNAATDFESLIKVFAKIGHLSCWDGRISLDLVRQARQMTPSEPDLYARFRDAYIGLTERTIAENDFGTYTDPRFNAALVKNLWVDDLAHLKGKSMQGDLMDQPAPFVNFLWCSNKNLKKLSDLFPGKVVVLDFWATWCKPCIGLFPKIRQISEQYKDKPVVFVGMTSIQGFHIDPVKGKIDCKGDPQKEISLMPGLMKQLNVTWTVAIGDKDCFNPDFDIPSIPHLSVIDRNGIVRYDGVEPDQLPGIIDGLLKG